MAAHIDDGEGRLLGIPTSPCADRWCTDSCLKETKLTETPYLTWFGKTVYIHGRESILFRDRKRITTQYMEEEEDHFTQTQLSALLLHLQLSTFSLVLYISHHSHLSQFALSRMPLFIGMNGATTSAFSSTKVAANSSSFSTMVATNL